MSGNSTIGGLVGSNGGAVTNSYSAGSVSGNSYVGGLVGSNWQEGIVSKSYSTAKITGGTVRVGGLVGGNGGGIVTNSFWDVQTSGQATSDGGTGKATAEMKNIATFSEATWSIEVVDSGHTWHIIDGETYPFLSWEL